MNKKISKLIFVLFSIYSTVGICQEYDAYQWQQSRKLYELSEEEEKTGLLYMKIAEHYEYVYQPSDEGLICFLTIHHIIRANNDEALSKSNRVYIPMNKTLELMDLKARVITSENKIINFDKDNIKALESEDASFRIFAVEGAEVGGEIEYYYTIKVNASSFITRVFQFPHPVKSYDFSLKCPENLEYDFKVYNHDGEVVQVDTSDQYNQYGLIAENIPPLYSEDFGAYENSKARIEFKLAYNSKRGKSRLFTWGEAGQRVEGIVYPINKDEQKAVDKLLKSMDLTTDNLSNLNSIEHHIKSNFFLQKEAGDEGRLLDKILKNKYATSEGFTRLYAAILKTLEIKHEIVLTSDKNKRAFDPEFDSWNYLDEYLIYINELEQFLSPKDIAFRTGTTPIEYLGSYGLFVRLEPIQDFIFPVARIGYIPEQSYKDNFDNMSIHVSFSKDIDQNTVNVERSFSGYSAEYYKFAMTASEEEDKKKILDEIIKYLALDADIKEIEISSLNTDFNSWRDPFTIKSTFTSTSYIESAGDIILFKAGELIGPQSEMYQERVRVMDITNDFNRGYLRKIIVDLPDGYSVKNPDDLVIKEQVNDEEKLIYNFTSSYEINGNQLEIEIDEYYDQLYFPKEKIEAFRKVINAAADWNKVVLVLSN